MRARKQFCCHGHDTFAPNARTPDGSCRACRNIASKKNRERCKTTWPHSDANEARLPFAPLHDSLLLAGLLPRIDSTTQRRWKALGITLSTADFLSCELLHKHPSEIWGAEWFQIGAA